MLCENNIPYCNGGSTGINSRPTPFYIVNDLPTVVQSCKVMQLYADDTTIYHSCHDSQQLQDTLANDLSSIAKWLKMNHLQMNVTKTKLLLLARRSRVQELELDKVKLSVNDVEVER